MTNRRPLDFAGLGIGPFNLSIAALMTQVPELSSQFFDAKPAFSWHPGMMLDNARLQTSYLKDLVTGVAPTSPYSFLNYLVSHRRFYPFLCAELPAVSREEYADYLAWVSRELSNLSFAQRIEAVELQGEQFAVHLSGANEPLRASALCLGTGLSPKLPDCVRPHLGQRCFHNADITSRQLDLKGLRVAVVGGGQSGAEVVEQIIAGKWGEPASLCWLSRRPNFEALDEIAFTNEYFAPQYVDTFFNVSAQRKAAIVRQQKLASDGISPDTLRSLYRALYEKRALGNLRYPVHFLPGRELVAMKAEAGSAGGLGLTARNQLQERAEHYQVDLVICCSGFEARLPDYLAPIAHRLHSGGDQPLALDRNFRVQWDGPEDLRLYAVNAGRSSHGIAEPQMSLMCWRSATIINDLVGREVFDLRQSLQMVDWAEPAIACGPSSDAAGSTSWRPVHSVDLEPRDSANDKKFVGSTCV